MKPFYLLLSFIFIKTAQAQDTLLSTEQPMIDDVIQEIIHEPMNFVRTDTMNIVFGDNSAERISLIFSKDGQINNLNQLISKTIDNKERINLVNRKVSILSEIYLDSAITLGKTNIKNAKKIGYKKGEAEGRIQLVRNYWVRDDDNLKAEEKENLKMAERVIVELKDSTLLAKLYLNYGVNHLFYSDFVEAYSNFRLAIDISQKIGNKQLLGIAYYNISSYYSRTHDYSKALMYLQKSLKLADEVNDIVLGANAILEIANIYGDTLDTIKSEQAYLKSMRIAEGHDFRRIEMSSYLGLSRVYLEQQKFHEAYSFAIKAEILAGVVGSIYGKSASQGIVKSAPLLRSSQKQMELSLNLKEQEFLIKREQLNKKMFIAGIMVLLVFAGLVIRNNRQKQKANVLLYKQKQEIGFQKIKAEKALDDLKATQAQLIQSEKMASLGKLTTGIAHEIQNPLNFVNNFSEVSNELLDEMNEEIKKGNMQEVITISSDIKQNLEKIHQHGKRADAIVKSMLQHGRSSTGHKEFTDINSLANEFLKLSYQGVRSKEKSFEATLQTGFDETIEKINLVPQDIGTVFINLYNNAFYSLIEKKRQMPIGFESFLWVSTKKINGKVEIRVKDNGNGISQNILDRIFQPFFTTKPTGQGTGLGLSLTYDIIKAHGGNIDVETKEGQWVEFIVQLPLGLKE